MALQTILLDSMGAQMQVQQQTGNRLTRWFQYMETVQGFNVLASDYQQPLATQLGGVDVMVSLTRQWIGSGPIPAGTCFGYSQQDLAFLQTWVSSGQGSIVICTNHSWPWGVGPFWPVNEIQLAAALGIQLVFAVFGPTGSSPVVSCPCPSCPMATLSMTPNPNAPAALIAGVSTVQAWDSGGIVPAVTGIMLPNGMVTQSGTTLVPLPPWSDCIDNSGLNYNPADCAFAVLYQVGKGNVIVLGHSGIFGDNDTCSPSPGQIGSGDNLTFIANCLSYLANNVVKSNG